MEAGNVIGESRDDMLVTCINPNSNRHQTRHVRRHNLKIGDVVVLKHLEEYPGSLLVLARKHRPGQAVPAEERKQLAPLIGTSLLPPSQRTALAERLNAIGFEVDGTALVDYAIDVIRTQFARHSPTVSESHVHIVEEGQHGRPLERKESYSMEHTISSNAPNGFLKCNYEWIVGVLVKFDSLESHAEPIMRLNKPHPLTQRTNNLVRPNLLFCQVINVLPYGK
jgi:hypothetical protein